MIIELKNIVKSYKLGQDDLEILHGINLDIESGEFLALTGPSGSGKSTLMNILGCLDRPSSGSYKLTGKEIASLNDEELAHIRNKQIGFVFQSFNLLPRLTAIDNVELPLVYAGVSKKERNQIAVTLLEKVGLKNRYEHRPNELSGGQRQRVAIARALVNNPDIIMADEPTGNLDSKSTREIMKIFHELHQQGKTIILVTHEQDIAKETSRQIKIVDGQIQNIGSNNYAIS